MLIKILLFILLPFSLVAQDVFNYSFILNKKNLNGVPALHSYSYAQHNGKWLIIGGRTDGLHPRQPFASFGAANNNTNVYVIDVFNNVVASAPVGSLDVNIAEQLQSTNMNFYQDGDNLLIIGGYAFSASNNNHITFPYLTIVKVSTLIDDIINKRSIQSNFTQIMDTNFAVTGGHLSKLGDYYYLVGGHKFTGRYNPMGGTSYVQTYSNQIRKFKFDFVSNKINGYSATTDPLHLRRRDYNLVPQIFPNGKSGFMISSGVFQQGVDLPFLYPVNIYEDNHEPITDFNQYLSNYHSAFVPIYDKKNNEMHSIFFGGISQYYYQNGELMKDDLVPFVKTISRLTRYSDNSLKEFKMDNEMPTLIGSSAEFIINDNIQLINDEIIDLNSLASDTTLIGHIYGGIISNSLNPFANNQTSTTRGSDEVYEVKLVKNQTTVVKEINGYNPYSFTSVFDSNQNTITVKFDLEKSLNIKFIVSTIDGKSIGTGNFSDANIGFNQYQINLIEHLSNQIIFVTLIFEENFYVTKSLIVN